MFRKITLSISLIFASFGGLAQETPLRILSVADVIGTPTPFYSDLKIEEKNLSAALGGIVPFSSAFRRMSSECSVNVYLGSSKEKGWLALAGADDFVSESLALLGVSAKTFYSRGSSPQIEKKDVFVCGRPVRFISLSGNGPAEAFIEAATNASAGFEGKVVLLSATSNAAASSLANNGFLVLHVSRTLTPSLNLGGISADYAPCLAEIPSGAAGETTIPFTASKGGCSHRTFSVVSLPFTEIIDGKSRRMGPGSSLDIIERVNHMGGYVYEGDSDAERRFAALSEEMMKRLVEMSVDVAAPLSNFSERAGVVAKAFMAIPMSNSDSFIKAALVDAGVAPIPMNRGVASWKDFLRTFPRTEDVVFIEMDGDSYRRFIENAVEKAVTTKNPLLLPYGDGIRWEGDLDAEHGERVYALSYRDSQGNRQRLMPSDKVVVLLPAGNIFGGIWSSFLPEGVIARRTGETVHSSIIFSSEAGPLSPPNELIEWPGLARFFSR